MRGRATNDRRPASGRAGFALLAVVWGVGLIATLVVAFMTSGRLRLQTASNIAGAVSAGYVAEAAINLTTLTLIKQSADAVSRGPMRTDSAPKFCVLDGAAVAVAIEDEGGKMDLNAAPPEALQALILGLGYGETIAKSVAQSIVAFRTPPQAGAPGRMMLAPPAPTDKPIVPKQGPFETVMELDQVGGVDPALYLLLLRFVTVNSRNPGVDPEAAPPALFAALAGLPSEDVRRLAAAPYPNKLNRKDPRFPANMAQMSERGAFLIHAEALLATGQTASRDALLDLRPLNGAPMAMKELRRSGAYYVDQLRALIAANGAGVPDC